MPRNRSAGRPAPSRPTVPARAPQPQQQRPATTLAAPPAQPPPQHMAAAAPAQAQGPGLFGQMASTAAGVAIGSSVGHAIGGFFGGGSSAPEVAPQQPVQAQAPSAAQHDVGNCQPVALSFTKCMDEHGGDMQICNWYLEQLKACQAAARPY